MYHGQVVIEGNLTKDPEIVDFSNESVMTKFYIAVNRYYSNKNKELVSETSFFTINTWGKLGEACAKFLRKGRGVRVVGRLKQETWTDKEGKNKEKVVIIAEHVEFQPERKKDSEEEDFVSAEELTDNQS